MSKKNKGPVTITLERDHLYLILHCLNYQIRKTERQQEAAMLSGGEVHPVAVRTAKRAKAIKQRIDVALAVTKKEKR